MDWVITIPSYKRAHTLREKTLKVLQDYQIPSQLIYIVVATPEEKKVYEETLSPDTYNRILIADVGLHKARNFINLYFPTGQKIVEADDDISGFIEWDETAHRHEKRLGSLIELIEQGFHEVKKKDCGLWGLYPSVNGYFMRPTVTTDLRLIVGSFWGQINPGDEIQIDMSEKEDYLRTALFFERDNCVIRINSVCPKTSYYKTSGGMNANTKRLEDQQKAVQELVSRYPSLLVENRNRKSGFPELRFLKKKSHHGPE